MLGAHLIILGAAGQNARKLIKEDKESSFLAI